MNCVVEAFVFAFLTNVEPCVHSITIYEAVVVLFCLNSRQLSNIWFVCPWDRYHLGHNFLEVHSFWIPFFELRILQVCRQATIFERKNNIDFRHTLRKENTHSTFGIYWMWCCLNAIHINILIICMKHHSRAYDHHHQVNIFLFDSINFYLVSHRSKPKETEVYTLCIVVAA